MSIFVEFWCRSSFQLRPDVLLFPIVAVVVNVSDICDPARASIVTGSRLKVRHSQLRALDLSLSRVLEATRGVYFLVGCKKLTGREFQRDTQE